MILFPGIGYHCDKPILYYGKKIAVMNGYTDCISLSYSYDGKNLRGNTAEMEKAFNSLYEQAEKQLNGVEFNQYDEILFVSKSIGTVIAAAYARKQRIPIYVYEDANHSLETGQVIQDLDILKDVMIKTNNYLSVEKH